MRHIMLLLSRRSTSLPRLSLSKLQKPRVNYNEGMRLSSTRSSALEYQKPAKNVIPERLLIYHAGTGRTVFVGSMKITTIFVFSVNLLLISPTFYCSPEHSIWVAPAVAIAGAIPMLYVMWASSPFVAYVHIKVPLVARRSKEQLLRWAQNIAPETELDLTTIKSYGRPRVSRMLVADLRPVKARLGIENLARLPRASPSKPKPWWVSNEQLRFFVGNERKKSIETSIWQKVLSQIEANKALARQSTAA